MDFYSEKKMLACLERINPFNAVYTIKSKKFAIAKKIKKDPNAKRYFLKKKRSKKTGKLERILKMIMGKNTEE